MFNTLIVQPIFNVLVLIYGLLPGHNFGLAIILFTILVRLLLWPLLKKQLHHAKAMRQLQPELKRIKKEAKGNRQLESQLTMALYKEKEINPFAPIGLLIVQLPILLALYSCINKIIHDPASLVNFAYPVVQRLPWIQELAADIARFDSSLFGVVDLTRAAISQGQPLYWPAFIMVVLSAVVQFFQSRQLMPQDKEARSLRSIMKSAGEGKQADRDEMNAAVGRMTQFFVPALVFIFTINLPSALSLYWLTSGVVAIIQQSRILRQDATELAAASPKAKPGEAIEGEVLPPKKKTKPAKKKAAKRKRR